MKSQKTVELAYDFLPAGSREILIARSDKGLASVMLADSQQTLTAELMRRFPAAQTWHTDDLDNEKTRVMAIMHGEATVDAQSLDMQGTAFQIAVWRALMTIPYATTLSYQQLATRVGSPSATRAVASACGANPLAIVVPCHRVLRKNGDLGGYFWGLETKHYLLALEQQIKHRRQAMPAV